MIEAAMFAVSFGDRIDSTLDVLDAESEGKDKPRQGI